MPRQNRIQPSKRSTRQNVKDPFLETISVLQEEMKSLRHKLCQEQKKRFAVEQELQRASERETWLWERLDTETLSKENRSMRTDNWLLKGQLEAAEQLLGRMGLSLPSAFDRE